MMSLQYWVDPKVWGLYGHTTLYNLKHLPLEEWKTCIRLLPFNLPCSTCRKNSLRHLQMNLGRNSITKNQSGFDEIDSTAKKQIWLTELRLDIETKNNNAMQTMQAKQSVDQSVQQNVQKSVPRNDKQNVEKDNEKTKETIQEITARHVRKFTPLHPDILLFNVYAFLAISLLCSSDPFLPQVLTFVELIFKNYGIPHPGYTEYKTGSLLLWLGSTEPLQQKPWLYQALLLTIQNTYFHS